MSTPLNLTNEIKTKCNAAAPVILCLLLGYLFQWKFVRFKSSFDVNEFNAIWLLLFCIYTIIGSCWFYISFGLNLVLQVTGTIATIDLFIKILQFIWKHSHVTVDNAKKFLRRWNASSFQFWPNWNIIKTNFKCSGWNELQKQNANWFPSTIWINEKIAKCQNTYLSLQHVSNEENHHTGINFIFCTPLVPSRYALAELSPNIIWRYDH